MAQPGHEKAVQPARVRQHAGQGAHLAQSIGGDARGKLIGDNGIDRVTAVIGKEPGNYILALGPFERADRIDENAAGLHPVLCPFQQQRLLLRAILDMARADAIEHVGMAAENAGGAARRIEQNGIGLLVRTPF